MPRTNLVTRIEIDLKEQLGDIAKKQNRTTSNLVEWLIKQYLEQITKRSAATPEADSWDKQIATDAEAGKLDFLLEEAQNDYSAGKLHFK